MYGVWEPTKKRNREERDDQTLIEDVRNADNDLDALGLISDIRHVNAAFQIRDRCPKVKPPRTDIMPVNVWYRNKDWMTFVINEFTNDKFDERNVFWIYDIIGGVGKSTLAKFLYAKLFPEVLIMTSLRVNDAAEVIKNAIKQGWTGKYLVVDLPRQAQHYEIWCPLEMIMNGIITSNKYSGTTMYLNRVRVLFLANFEPRKYKIAVNGEETKEPNMSLDRWRIGQITTNMFGKNYVTMEGNLPLQYTSEQQKLIDPIPNFKIFNQENEWENAPTEPTTPNVVVEREYCDNISSTLLNGDDDLDNLMMENYENTNERLWDMTHNFENNETERQYLLGGKPWERLPDYESLFPETPALQLANELVVSLKHLDIKSDKTF